MNYKYFPVISTSASQDIIIIISVPAKIFVDDY